MPPEEKVSTTQHTITIDGKQIAYTANAGTMVLRDDDGKAQGHGLLHRLHPGRRGAGQAARDLLLQRRTRLGVHLARHGDHEPEAPRHGPRGRPARAPVRPGGQPQLPSGRDGPGPGRRHDDGLFPARRRRAGLGLHRRTQRHQRCSASSSATTWTSTTAGSRPSTCSARATAPSGRRGWPPSSRSGEGIELNGIMLLGTVLDLQYIAPSPTNDIGYSHLPAHLHRHGVVPQEAAGRPPEPDAGAGGAAVARLRLRRLHDGAGQGQRTDAGRAGRRGREARAAHGRVGAVHPQHQPPHRRRDVPHGAAARPA